eukprot:gene15295-biopygen11219
MLTNGTDGTYAWEIYNLHTVCMPSVATQTVQSSNAAAAAAAPPGKRRWGRVAPPRMELAAGPGGLQNRCPSYHLLGPPFQPLPPAAVCKVRAALLRVDPQPACGRERTGARAGGGGRRPDPVRKTTDTRPPRRGLRTCSSVIPPPDYHRGVLPLLRRDASRRVQPTRARKECTDESRGGAVIIPGGGG